MPGWARVLSPSMRGLALSLSLVATACTLKEDPRPVAAVAPAPAVAPEPPPQRRARSTAVDAQVDSSACSRAPIDVAQWAGRWDGARPFDNANPFLHRGPTSVRITAVDAGVLQLSEGVGAAGYQVELEVDPAPFIARGEKLDERSAQAIAVGADLKPTGERPQISISKRVALAACMSPTGELVLWRALSTSGTGIQAQSEDDVVRLTRRPPAPVLPPPPGFTVLADQQKPDLLALAPDDVVWTSFVDGEGRVMESAIRAMSRKGGAVRELVARVPYVHAIVVREGAVYYASHSHIGRVPLAGGPAETLVDDVVAMKLAVDAQRLVYVLTDDHVYVRSISGGEPRALYAAPEDSQLAELALDGSAVYVVVNPISLREQSKVLRVPLKGGAPSTLATLQQCGDALLHGGALYLGTCSGDLVRVAVSGGLTRLGHDEEPPASIAVAGSTLVYAAANGAGKVSALPVAGGKPHALVEGDYYPDRVAVDPKEPRVAYVLDKGPMGDEPLGRIGTVAVK